MVGTDKITEKCDFNKQIERIVARPEISKQVFVFAKPFRVMKRRALTTRPDFHT